MAYLRLSDAYEADAATAQTRGWVVDRMEAGHLHTAVDPAAVADRILGLLRHGPGHEGAFDPDSQRDDAENEVMSDGGDEDQPAP